MKRKLRDSEHPGKSPKFALGFMQENWDLGQIGEIKQRWTLEMIVGFYIRLLEKKPTIPTLWFAEKTIFP